MNYLQLAQRLRQECAVTGTAPTSVLNQTGMAGLLVNWIDAAWMEIQGLHNNWNWMREPFAFDTVANTQSYLPTAITNTLTNAAMTDLRYWHKDTFRAQKKSIGVQDEQWLVEWEYQVFRNTYQFNVQVAGRPVVFAEGPNGRPILLGSIPDDVYKITGEYQKKASHLVNDGDEPACPEAYHLLIVYKAMQSYALYEAAAEVLQRGQTEYQKLLTQLEHEQLPDIYLGNPLA
jgi:hypothetical protein